MKFITTPKDVRKMWVLEDKITQEDSEYFKKAIRNFVIINTLLSLIYGIIIGALINL